uniref:ATP synthase F0 subunit 8 n=1 Tax=Acrobeloides nanus TaxID=290746 RepID=A0A914DEE4_9BILA
MVDLKQQLDVLDYFGPLAVWICFFSIVFIISVTCILWCCVSEKDDSTVFAKGIRNKRISRSRSKRYL